MPSVHCPLCNADNPAGATACAACGVGFVVECRQCDTINPAQTPRCVTCGHRLGDGAAAAPAGAATALDLIEPRPILGADELTAPSLRSWAGVSAEPERVWPELVDSGDLVGTFATTETAPAAVDVAADALERERRLTAKALARQAARRARLGDAERAIATSPDVLVLDGNDATRGQLCGLLGAFGFHVFPAQTLAQADTLLKARPFAAAFLDIVLDGADEGAGIELCYRIKHGSDAVGGHVHNTAVVVLSAQVRPADRVRAALARSDVYLAKPVSRGDVARALESCGVPLPSDARRG